MIWATSGAVTAGLCLLGWYVISWWPGRKALMGKKKVGYILQLLPFLFGWAYGALGVLSVMGLIGWGFDSALWIANWLGDAANWLAVGAKAGQTSRGTYVPLTDDGGRFVVILTVCLLAVLKFRPAIAQELKWGIGSGLCLGTSSSIAGLAAVPLAQAANDLGAIVFAWFSR